MKKFLFIGIDFSKSTFDVTLLENIGQTSFVQQEFENEAKGYKSFLKWLVKQSKIKRDTWLFCGEHTGLYSRGLSEFLAKKNLFVWLENPLQIKCSWGIKRAKTDKIDSLEIARYAIRFQDKAIAYKPVDKEIDSLKLLFSYRERLVKIKVAMEISAKEIRRVISHDQTSRYIFEDSMREIERIKKKIGNIESKMHNIIINSQMRENYLLVMSIKGVGMITTISMIIRTNNFISFENSKQLACYCGCAPFEKKSGTSINGGTHISRLANRELKTLLTQCARSAALHNKELSVYYQRKIAEGKLGKVVINNIRNKLIQLIFAVIKHKTPYRENYLNPWAECA
jgi:transposase